MRSNLKEYHINHHKGVCNLKKFSLPFWVVKKRGGVSCVRITDYGLVKKYFKKSVFQLKKKKIFFFKSSIEFLNKIRGANFQSVIRNFFKMSGKKKGGGVRIFSNYRRPK